VGVVRHVITRSKEKEAALQKRLKDFDLVQIQTLLSGMGGLPPRIRYAVVPENPFPTRECAWIEFLHGKGAETLRGEGWVIEAEESALLVVHDVQEFTPQLEHDSSIDWFRFDAAFEIEGRRISLIPLIADYLARFDGIPEEGDPEAAEWIMIPVEDFKGGVARFPARRFFGLVENVRHLLTGSSEGNGALRVHRLQAAGLAAEFQLDASPTLLALKKLGETLREFKGLPAPKPPSQLKGSLRAYQLDGFHWMQFLARNDLHGILADDMGLGKTVQALTHLLAEKAGGHSERKPSLVLAPTSVVPNWESEAKRFAPSLKTLVLHGPGSKLQADREIGSRGDLIRPSVAGFRGIERPRVPRRDPG
jgi:hypothetical protein